jgi:hypothetical protein
MEGCVGRSTPSPSFTRPVSAASRLVRRDVISLPAPAIWPQKTQESGWEGVERCPRHRGCEGIFGKCLRLTETETIEILVLETCQEATSAGDW